MRLGRWFWAPFRDVAWIGLLLLLTGQADPAALPTIVFGGKLPAMFRPEILFWADDIDRWSRKYNVSPLLVATVMQIESCGDPYAQSAAGAMGLFQVMPFHFTAGENGFDPEINAKRGLIYLTQRQSAAGADVTLTLGQYNSGQAALYRPFSTWPPETKRYVFYGVQIYNDAVAGKSSSDALESWYDVYGKSLCAEAAANQSEMGIVQYAGRDMFANIMALALAAPSGARNAVAMMSPYLAGLDIPGNYGGGRAAVTIPNCVVAPAANHNPKWLPRSPYRVPAVHTRTGHGLHGCFVGLNGSHWVGVDITAGLGTTIYAPINGLVTNIYTDGVSNTIIVFDNPEFMAVLLHGNYDGAKQGQPVTRGSSVVGVEASKGNSTGPHSHYQLYDKLAGGWVDPFAFFDPGAP